MRHRGMQMWRRISQTVSHPTDSKNNRSDVTSGSEDRNSSTSNIQIRLTSATPAPVHSRRSNIFGHRFSRTFYPQRHSEALSGSSSSINSEADNTLTTSLDSDMLNGSSDESHRPNNRHQTPSCHDFLALSTFLAGETPSRTFPLISDSMETPRVNHTDIPLTLEEKQSEPGRPTTSRPSPPTYETCPRIQRHLKKSRALWRKCEPSSQAQKRCDAVAATRQREHRGSMQLIKRSFDEISVAGSAMNMQATALLTPHLPIFTYRYASRPYVTRAKTRANNVRRTACLKISTPMRQTASNSTTHPQR